MREALLARRRRLDRLWLRSGAPGAERADWLELAGSAGVSVEVVEPAAFEAGVIAEGNDQGVALKAGPLLKSKRNLRLS